MVDAIAEGKPRLSNTLKNAVLSISEEDGIKKVDFEVINEAQKSWIEKEQLRNMETMFREMLSTSRLHISVSVNPAEEVEQKVYMPAEKAQELMKNNPEVLNLVKDLGLDTN